MVQMKKNFLQNGLESSQLDRCLALSGSLSTRSLTGPGNFYLGIRILSLIAHGQEITEGEDGRNAICTRVVNGRSLFMGNGLCDIITDANSFLVISLDTPVKATRNRYIQVQNKNKKRQKSGDLYAKEEKQLILLQLNTKMCCKRT